ncbi:hypothetical protein BMS3Bbin16_01048 [archaeon BMS3Bbin16]|nr:hypothetical protein BMS3Bbin16_01048 [archaeon BMS3Bbin16]
MYLVFNFFVMNIVGPMGFSRFLTAVFLISLSILCYEAGLPFEFTFMFRIYLSAGG